MGGARGELILLYGGSGQPEAFPWSSLSDLRSGTGLDSLLVLWDVSDALGEALTTWAHGCLSVLPTRYSGPAAGVPVGPAPPAGLTTAAPATGDVVVAFTACRARDAFALLAHPERPTRLVPADLDLRREAVLFDLGRLYDLTDRLRRECPWDRKQTQEDIVAYTLEETYELIDAVRTPGERRDDLIAGELGDLLFQVYFLARVAEGEGWYDLGEVAEGIRRKLVRRHPHIFGDAVAETPEQVRRTWDEIKRTTEGREGIFHEVPVAFPAVLFAQKLQQRAAIIGFDWERAGDVLAKIREEADELEEAMAGEDPARVADEAGDLLFAMVNLARKLKVDPELALRASSHRFQERVERAACLAQAEGRDFEGLSLDEKETYFQQAKAEIREAEQGASDDGGRQG